MGTARQPLLHGLLQRSAAGHRRRDTGSVHQRDRYQCAAGRRVRGHVGPAPRVLPQRRRRGRPLPARPRRGGQHPRQRPRGKLVPLALGGQQGPRGHREAAAGQGRGEEPEGLRRAECAGDGAVLLALTAQGRAKADGDHPGPARPWLLGR